MDVDAIVEKLKNKYPGKNIVLNKDNKGKVIEIVCEVEPSFEHPDYSKAVAVVDKTVPHYHKNSTEVYRVIHGSLNLFY